MKVWRFRLTLKREPKPLSEETVTLMAQLVDGRLRDIEANLKETRTRLETIYRKVYRDAAKESPLDAPAGDALDPAVAKPRLPVTIRPGDPLSW